MAAENAERIEQRHVSNSPYDMITVFGEKSVDYSRNGGYSASDLALDRPDGMCGLRNECVP